MAKINLPDRAEEMLDYDSSDSSSDLEDLDFEALVERAREIGVSENVVQKIQDLRQSEHVDGMKSVLISKIETEEYLQSL